MKALPCLALCLACAAAHAQAPEPQVQRQVSEDDQVRIEELKVRGETQRIVVRNKSGQLKGSQYQLLPGSAARDPSQGGPAAGQRVWSFSF